MLDADKLTPTTDRRVAEKQNVEARKKAHQILLKAFWDHRLNHVSLLELAFKLQTTAGFLTPYVIGRSIKEVQADLIVQ